MSRPILVTGAAGGTQGSTGRLVASLLLEQGIPVRALVHKLDSRSDGLRKQGAEVIEGDLLNPASVRAALRDVKRAYFTYPVADGLLEAVTIFAAAARDAGLELVVNNSQLQSTHDDPAFRDLQHAPSFRNLQHRLADRIFDWAQVGAVHLQAPPYYENVRALVSRSVAEQSTVFLPWGEDTTVIPLVGAEDVSHVAARLLGNPRCFVSKCVPLGQRDSYSERDDGSSRKSNGTADSIRGNHGRAVGKRGKGADQSSRARSSVTSLAVLPEG